MSELGYWLPVLCAGLLAGGASGTLGTYIVGMRIPFLAVCVSHAAMAGAVFGVLAGWSGQTLLLPALGGAVLTALALGALERAGVRIDSNLFIGVLFSLSLGLAFLGIGLLGRMGRPDNEVRSILWGSLLVCNWSDVWILGAVTALLLAFVGLFRKELRAILFSRVHAEAAGIPVGPLWAAFLVLTSLVLTVSFQTVGGLMIYSLVTNPALTAVQLVRGHDRVLLLSGALGAAVTLIGFWIAALTNLPVGATIVILSSLMVGAAALARR